MGICTFFFFRLGRWSVDEIAKGWPVSSPPRPTGLPFSEDSLSPILRQFVVGPGEFVKNVLSATSTHEGEDICCSRGLTSLFMLRLGRCDHCFVPHPKIEVRLRHCSTVN